MIIGNWKMNTARADAVALAETVANIEHQASTRVGICPPALWIDPIAHILEGSSILLGAKTVLVINSELKLAALTRTWRTTPAVRWRF